LKNNKSEIRQIFETERLLLVPTSIGDAQFIIELMNMPKWYKFIGDRNVRTLEQANEYLKNKIIKERIEKGVPNYTVIRKSDSVKIGKSGLVSREGLDCMDIGFSLRKLGFEHTKMIYLNDDPEELMYFEREL